MNPLEFKNCWSDLTSVPDIPNLRVRVKLPLKAVAGGGVRVVDLVGR